MNDAPRDPTTPKRPRDEFDGPTGARLTALMERAVAEPLESVDAPKSDVLTFHRSDHTRRRARWAAITSIAAAALLGVGVVALDGDGDRTVRTAEGGGGGQPVESIYRVPTALPEGLTVRSANVGDGAAELIAVDDITNPGRWLVITLNGSMFAGTRSEPAPEPITIPLPGSRWMFLRHLRASGSATASTSGDLIHVAVTGATKSFPTFTMLAHGLDDDWLETSARTAAAAIPPDDGKGVPTNQLGPVAEVFAELRLPDGLERVGAWSSAVTRYADIVVESAPAEGQGPIEVPGGVDGGCNISMRGALAPAIGELVEQIGARFSRTGVARQPVDPDLGLPESAVWLLDDSAPPTTTADLHLDDGSSAVEIGCWVPAGRANAEAVARQRAAVIARGLRPVASEDAFRSTLEAQGVTVEGG